MSEDNAAEQALNSNVSQDRTEVQDQTRGRDTTPKAITLSVTRPFDPFIPRPVHPLPKRARTSGPQRLAEDGHADALNSLSELINSLKAGLTVFSDAQSSILAEVMRGTPQSETVGRNTTTTMTTTTTKTTITTTTVTTTAILRSNIFVPLL
ncbi:hypothetical protein BT96DRAFT_1002486 [Gymnopus androsaceus JB14]|uniref:Uncharacterized protein n=1 Tax=Gymnopus androsaceus JB14 TaxID=1447944 RepID=A0A6A4GYR4_9AGAR|nr:hypothetical protein BT96DRAFT_1002486 [Gymnopus androsaceus JB14]